jgi:hypothetical protein
MKIKQWLHRTMVSYIMFAFEVTRKTYFDKKKINEKNEHRTSNENIDEQMGY